MIQRFQQLHRLLDEHYTDEDQLIIAAPTTEQVPDTKRVKTHLIAIEHLLQYKVTQQCYLSPDAYERARWFTCPQTDTHSSSNHLIAT